jgi:opacity protein-like surface antigen
MPFVIGAGFSYKESANWLFEADYESRQYKSSDVQLNLYEFGGKPVWNNINILRAGVQYTTNGDYQIPFRAGYEYVPQLYYSGNSTGQSNTVSNYVNTDRNIKHILTLGTSLNIKKLVLDLAFEYSILKWHQVLVVPQTINDDYTDTNFSFSVGIVYKI